jgi:glucokinase
MNHTICLDVGGTNIRGALFQGNDVEPIKLKKIPTQQDGQKVEERICNLISSIWPENGKVNGIALAAPGFVDSEKGMVIRAVNIPGWEYLPLRNILEEKFNHPVFIENDARLAALGEYKFGAGIGHHDLIYLTISTGIGGGVIIKDRLLTGSRGLATEIGHTTILPDGPLCSCGHKGHLEAISSGTAIARFVKDQIKVGKNSALAIVDVFSSKEVAQAALAGDEVCQSAFHQAGTYLGKSIANLLHIFNPSCLIFGGGVSLSGDLLFDPMRKELERTIISKEYLKNLSIAVAKLGDNAGLIGGLVLIDSKT